MNLAKRASLLILPVIIISSVLATWSVYDRQSQSLHKLEQNRLELKASQLQSAFSSYAMFIDAYLTSLMEGDILASFIRTPENIYRGRMLTSHMQSAIKRFQGQGETFASLTVLSEEQVPLLYVENSQDPFSNVKPAQFELAKKLQVEKKLTSWEHLHGSEQGLIQRAIALDSSTFSTPIASRVESAVKVIVAVVPEQFDLLLAQTQREYQAQLVFNAGVTDIQLPDLGLGAQVQLSPGYWLQITPDETYLSNQLYDLRLQLALTAIIGSLLVYLLLHLLIRRYITQPITALDSQLTEVMAKQRKNIECPETGGEVARLAGKFHLLYEQLHEAFEQSYEQSRTDALTKLPNRSAFYETALNQLRHGDQSRDGLSVIYLDLDNFKFVNDKYGHHVGDELLKTISQRIAHVVQSHTAEHSIKCFYRLSGDEFITLLPGADRYQAEKVAEKVLQLFTHGVKSEHGNFPVSASLGIATFPHDGHTLEQLVANADLAMFQAKNSGKNKLSFYSRELAKSDRKVKEIESSLKELDCDQELMLHYMPIVDGSGHVKSCEALLRWSSPTLGQVSPADFIPVAETTGTFEKIDLWVVERAFSDYPKLQALFGDHCRLSINLSSAECSSEQLLERLRSLISHYEVDPAMITLEITETFALELQPRTVEWLCELQSLGFLIAIDDFGTGYTSLMQMVDYPVNTIKFDKQLVERISADHHQHLMKALIDLCHLQKMEVVAEGVETDHQSQHLWQAGCDYQQGFLIAKPMSLDKLKSWQQKQTNLLLT